MSVVHNKEKCFCTLSNSSELERIREFVVACAQKFGFDGKVSHNIALAVDEACSNLIKYAFRNDTTNEIQVKIKPDDNNNFVIYILDQSNPFDPTLTQSPDMAEYFKSFRKGGLGIHIMKLVMDEINYFPRTQKSKYNKLVLKKNLN